MQYQVLKPMEASGRKLAPGDFVEDAGWPAGRAAMLVAQRKLMPAGVAPEAPLPRIGSRRPKATDARGREAMS